MKLRNVVTLAAVAVLLAACIPSVNPFYTEKDVVFDERLLGEWQAKEAKADVPELWNFEKADGKATNSQSLRRKGSKASSRPICSN